MKIRLLTLISALVLSLLSYPSAAREHIYLMAGQSNMMGLAHTHHLPASYRATPANVSFFYKGMGVIDPIGRDYPEVSLVQQAQRTVNATVAHTHLISAEGVAKIYDNIHFNALGQVEMGQRFARQYIELVR